MVTTNSSLSGVWRNFLPAAKGITVREEVSVCSLRVTDDNSQSQVKQRCFISNIDIHKQMQDSRDKVIPNYLKDSKANQL